MNWRRSSAWLFLGFAGMASFFWWGAASAQARGETSSHDAHVATFDAAWQAVFETHFDPEFNGVDWKGVREELRPAAEAAKTVSELRRVIGQMLSRLGQSHFALIPGEGGDPSDKSPDQIARDDALAAIPQAHAMASPGLDVRWMENSVIVTSLIEGFPAAKEGVKPGWRIEALDGKFLAESFREFSEDLKAWGMESTFERDRPYLVWGFVHRRLAGVPDTEVEVEFVRGDGSRQTLVLRRKPSPWKVESSLGMPAFPIQVRERWVSSSVATIGISGMWLLGVMPAFDESFRRVHSARGVILDLRGNLGGISTVAQGVAGGFFSRGGTLGTFKTRHASIPVSVSPRPVEVGEGRVDTYDGPVAILIDGLSGSATEVFAAGLQDAGRARVFGEPSMGAALPSIISELPNGDTLLHAVSDYLRPKGGSVEGNPVMPDEVVKQTRATLLRGEDPVMAAALKWIVGEG